MSIQKKEFMKKICWSSPKILLLIVVASLIALPFLIGAGFLSLVIEMLIMGIAASGLNLMMGYSGMVNFGPAGPYAVGAYTTALLLVKTGAPFGFAMIAGPVAAAMVGAIVGWFCVRLTHIYFALLTLAFSQLIFTIAYEWYGFTGGDNGIVGIRVPDFLAPIDHYYYFTLAITIVCLGLIWIIIHSPFGKTIQAYRENPERTEFIGIDTKRYRLKIFVLHSFFLGVAGSMYCGFNHNVFANYAHWLKGTDFMIACLLGGMYNFFGPVVGAAAYVFLEKLVISYTEYWLFVLGLIIILLSLFLSGGIVGFIAEKFSVIRGKYDTQG